MHLLSDGTFKSQVFDNIYRMQGLKDIWIRVNLEKFLKVILFFLSTSPV
jgi:hypothetical protein